MLLLAPLAPHVAEELWARLGHEQSLAWHPFPEADERWLVEATVQVAVQVNGKVRAQVTVPADADAAARKRAWQEWMAAIHFYECVCPCVGSESTKLTAL